MSEKIAILENFPRTATARASSALERSNPSPQIANQIHYKANSYDVRVTRTGNSSGVGDLSCTELGRRCRPVIFGPCAY